MYVTERISQLIQTQEDRAGDTTTQSTALVKVAIDVAKVLCDVAGPHDSETLLGLHRRCSLSLNSTPHYYEVVRRRDRALSCLETLQTGRRRGMACSRYTLYYTCSSRFGR